MKAKVDSREPKMLRAVAKQEYGYEQDTIEQGDFYLPEKDVVVERKEASDFASSTTEGRLSKQADRMIAEHDHVYLIIENSIEGKGNTGLNTVYSLYNLKHSNVSENSLTGMQTSLAVKRGIKIIYTESVEQTLYAVNRIFERFMDGEHEEQGGGYVKTADTGEIGDVRAAMLMQIKGISEGKALEISEVCSVANIVKEPESSKKRICKIDGIGPTLAERVIEAFQ